MSQIPKVKDVHLCIDNLKNVKPYQQFIYSLGKMIVHKIYLVGYIIKLNDSKPDLSIFSIIDGTGCIEVFYPINNKDTKPQDKASEGMVGNLSQKYHNSYKNSVKPQVNQKPVLKLGMRVRVKGFLKYYREEMELRAFEVDAVNSYTEEIQYMLMQMKIMQKFINCKDFKGCDINNFVINNGDELLEMQKLEKAITNIVNDVNADSVATFINNHKIQGLEALEAPKPTTTMEQLSQYKEREKLHLLDPDSMGRFLPDDGALVSTSEPATLLELDAKKTADRFLQNLLSTFDSEKQGLINKATKTATSAKQHSKRGNATIASNQPRSITNKRKHSNRNAAADSCSQNVSSKQDSSKGGLINKHNKTDFIRKQGTSATTDTLQQSQANDTEPGGSTLANARILKDLIRSNESKPAAMNMLKERMEELKVLRQAYTDIKNSNFYKNRGKNLNLRIAYRRWVMFENASEQEPFITEHYYTLLDTVGIIIEDSPDRFPIEGDNLVLKRLITHFMLVKGVRAPISIWKIYKKLQNVFEYQNVPFRVIEDAVGHLLSSGRILRLKNRDFKLSDA